MRQDKIQNFSSVYRKLCLLGQKYTGTRGVNTTRVNTHKSQKQVYVKIILDKFNKIRSLREDQD